MLRDQKFNINSIILFTVLILAFSQLYFFKFSIPITWLLVGFFTVVLFFFCYNNFAQNWKHLNEIVFRKRLFRLNLICGSIGTALVLVAFYFQTDSFSEPGAADSLLYHTHGIDLAKMFERSDYRVAKYLIDSRLDDFGYNIYLGVLYYLVGPNPIVAMVLNVFLHAYSVVLLFKISNRIFGIEVARKAGLIMSFFPVFFMYMAMNLKETLLIYLLLSGTYYCIMMVENRKFNLSNLLILIFFTISLFFFRNVLGLCFLVAILVYFSINIWKVKKYRFPRLAAILLVSTVVFYQLIQLGIKDEVFLTADRSLQEMEVELSDKASRGNGLSLDKVAVGPLIALSGIVAPFPTLVFLDDQVLIVWNFPSMLIKSLLSIFTFIGLWHAIKHRLTASTLPLSIFIIYIIVLIVSAQVTSQRYQIIVLPFFCLFLAYGIEKAKNLKPNVWFLNLLACSVVILAWNFFKIYIRNL